MLAKIARKLDDWALDKNVEAAAGGLPRIRPCTLRLLGQTALFEANIELTLATTKGVDLVGDYDYAVRAELERLLAVEGRELDPLNGEIWMPRETDYFVLFSGELVRVLVAEPEAVLVSKALKAPLKNRPLITEYLARGPSKRFFDLAAKYSVELEAFA